jgi:hypothetical protein
MHPIPPPPPLQLSCVEAPPLYADGLPKDLGSKTVQGLQTKIMEGTKQSERYWTQVGGAGRGGAACAQIC